MKVNSSSGPGARLRRAILLAGPRHNGPARNPATAAIAATPSVLYLGGALLGSHRVDTVGMIIGLLLAAGCAALIITPARAATAAGLRLAATVVGSASIVVLDLASGNAGVTGQLFFCMPILFAAVHLRVPGVAIVTTSALIGEATVVAVLLPPTEALLNFVFVGSIFGFMAAALARSGVAQDRLIAQLRRQAGVDSLTGLVTRRTLDEAMHNALARSDDEVGTALILIDVDRFKAINDTYGHAVGDDALAHIAQILTERCRNSDVVARLGGDELAVLIPGCGYDIADKRAKDLVEAVRNRPLTLADDRTITLSVSAGAAHAPSGSTIARDLYVSADTALYAAKRERHASYDLTAARGGTADG